jgi:integrase
MPLEHAQGLYESTNDQDCRILIALGHYAGLRISEAFSVVINHSDSLGIFLDVAGDFDGKTAAATRQIPAASGLVAILNETSQLPPSGSSLTINWGVRTTSGLDKRFRKLKAEYFSDKESVEAKQLVYHSLRHAFATYLANKFGELMASTLTGHKGSEKALTELGRTYFHGSEWGEKTKMIISLPPLVLER